MEPSTKLTDEVFAELKAKHGDVIGLETDDGAAVFRAPTRQEWERFLKEQASEDTKAAAHRPLIMGCRVWPEKDAFDALVARKPGILLSFGGELIEFAGLKRVQVRKT
jgi:hypothetical protein